MTKRISEYTRAGLTFPVTDSGPIDGEVVVLLHGFPQTRASWNPTAELLHAEGFRTIVPTMRGYAPSAKPRWRWQYRSSVIADDIGALLRLTGPAHLVGHDWGAASAWATATTHRDLVKTLTSVSVPHPLAFLRSFLRSAQGVQSYYMYLFQLPVLPELVAARAPQLLAGFLRRTNMPEQAITAVLDQLVTPGLLGGGLDYYRAMPFTAMRPGAANRVSIPVTHVWSRGDVALSQASAELAGDYADGPYRLVVLDGSHWLPDEQPQELAQVISENARQV